jgi:aldose 1-epimerase
MTGSIAGVPDAATVPDASELVLLTAADPAAHVSVVVAPTAGGRVGQITVAGQPVLVDMPTEGGHPMGWGSFPMAPWAGRIRAGRFAFDGVEHQLQLNHVDGGGPGRSHSIHGTVFTRRWSVVDQTAAAITMTCPLAGALDWPFGGTAHQHIEVGSDRVTCTLRIDTDDGRFPAELGWHPWFRKPDHLEFAPTTMYQRDEVGIATGELVQPTEPPWDDCFVNTEPVVLHYDRPLASRVTVTSDCDHWVVYDHPTDATCVEPQSGPPDAFNLGAHVVSRGAELRRTMTITW